MQKQKDVPIKKRIITAIVVVGIFCVLFICMFFIGLRRGGLDFSAHRMTKWEGKNYELYIFESPFPDDSADVDNSPCGILVYHCENKKEYVYDVVFRGWIVRLYEHRENPDDDVDLVAYYRVDSVSRNKKKVKCSQLYPSDSGKIYIWHHYEDERGYYYPQKLKLKKTEENLNIDDIPYKYCYSNPLIYRSKNFYVPGDVGIFYLNISDDNTTGTLTWKVHETGEEKEYKVTFDSEQIMMVYDKYTEEKIISYYIFSKETGVFYAVMEEEYDDNCIFKEYIGFIRN